MKEKYGRLVVLRLSHRDEQNEFNGEWAGPLLPPDAPTPPPREQGDERKR